MNSLILVRRVVYIIFDLIILLLLGRFLLRFFSANPATPVVQFIYSLSAPLMQPFRGAFGSTSIGPFVLDWTNVFAMLIYAVLGYLIGWLIASLVPRRRVVVERGDPDQDL